MNAQPKAGNGFPLQLRMAVIAASLSVVACFGAAVGFANAPVQASETAPVTTQR